MTDEQVVKALECCIKGECSKCPLSAMVCGDEVVMRYALDLIKRQQAEIERQKSMNQAKLDTIHDLRAEIEDLKENKGFPFFTNDTQVVTVSQKSNGQYSADIVTQIQVDKIRAEAYEEFAERLKAKSFTPLGTWFTEKVVTDIDISNVLKELTEGKDDE